MIEYSKEYLDAVEETIRTMVTFLNAVDSRKPFHVEWKTYAGWSEHPDYPPNFQVEHDYRIIYDKPKARVIYVNEHPTGKLDDKVHESPEKASCNRKCCGDRQVKFVEEIK